MSSKNKRARKQLEKIYGKGCFIERMGIRKIKGYKPTDKIITYHHIKKKSEGGKSTVENGANLAWENHVWLHSLSEEQQKDLNNRIVEWKMNFLILNSKEKTCGSLDFPKLTEETDCVIIPLENTTKKDLEELERQKNLRKQRFNRSEVKRHTQKLINEELYGESYEL